MRLVHKRNGLEIDIEENTIYVLVVENQKEFSSLLTELHEQLLGHEGDFLLSDGSDVYEISKDCEVIFDPISLEPNSKKVISHLYKELKEISNEHFSEIEGEINRLLINYFDMLQGKSLYALDYNTDFNVSDYFKTHDLRLMCEYNNLLERIIEYLRVASEICEHKVFFFVNLKSYLSQEELIALYDFSFYSKIHLFMIEGSQGRPLPQENLWIIDKDLCIIKCS